MPVLLNTWFNDDRYLEIKPSGMNTSAFQIAPKISCNGINILGDNFWQSRSQAGALGATAPSVGPIAPYDASLCTLCA